MYAATQTLTRAAKVVLLWKMMQVDKHIPKYVK
jgi:hypothetical protein